MSRSHPCCPTSRPAGPGPVGNPRGGFRGGIHRLAGAAWNLVLLAFLVFGDSLSAAEGIGEEAMVRPTRVWMIPADSPPIDGEPNTATGWQEVPALRGWQREWRGAPTALPLWGWYRLEFVVNEEARRRNWVASAGFVGNQSELFFNGNRLGNFGQPNSLVPLPQRTLHALPIPPGSLRPGTNWFDVRFHNDAGVGGILGGPVGLFPAEEIPAVRSRAEFGRELFRGFVSGFSILAGIGALAALWVVREGRLPSLALPLLLLGIQNLIHSQALMGRAGMPAVRTIGTALLPLSMYWLSRRLAGRNRWIDAYVVGSTILIYLLGFFAFPNPKAVQGLFGLLLIVCGSGMFLNFLRHRHHLDLTAKAFAVSLVAFGFAATWDLSLRSIPSIPWAALWWDPVEWAGLFFILSNGWVLLFHDVRLSFERDRIARRMFENEESSRRESAVALRQDAEAGAGDIKRSLEELRDCNDPDRRNLLLGNLSAVVSRFQRRLHQTADFLQPMQDVPLETAMRRFEVTFRSRYRIPLYIELPKDLGVGTKTAELVYLTMVSILDEKIKGASCRSSRVALRREGDFLELRIEVPGGHPPNPKDPQPGPALGSLDRIRWIGGTIEEGVFGDGGYLLVARIPTRLGPGEG